MRYDPAMLSFMVCNAARLRRDPRYDGRFFTAVKTTKIYCRPVCLAKQPLTRNVTYYPTAAAAEAVDYRPCLRCRPETAPFCPAWNGTRSTVARAMKLIDAGALDRDSVASLDDRLGISPRHLARLFDRQVGASPKQVASTRRLQCAKRWLDASDEPMTEIAFRAGFRSGRRFNAALLDPYGRSPSSLRATRRSSARHRGSLTAGASTHADDASPAPPRD
jgi:AraC family transcriptional regulator of adaptative response / DNA-3-methyladenine glycosylase II